MVSRSLPVWYLASSASVHWPAVNEAKHSFSSWPARASSGLNSVNIEFLRYVDHDPVADLPPQLDCFLMERVHQIAFKRRLVGDGSDHEEVVGDFTSRDIAPGLPALQVGNLVADPGRHSDRLLGHRIAPVDARLEFEQHDMLYQGITPARIGMRMAASAAKARRPACWRSPNE